MLKSVSQNVMLLCLLLLSRFWSMAVLRQWSLAPPSKGTAMHVVAMVTKLRSALTQEQNRQLPISLPTTTVKHYVYLSKNYMMWLVTDSCYLHLANA